jgi:restriction system protein
VDGCKAFHHVRTDQAVTRWIGFVGYAFEDPGKGIVDNSGLRGHDRAELRVKFKMSEKSLFAVLLRSPWWISFVLVAVIALLAGALLPGEYKGVGMLGGFPFFVIGCMALWRQRNLPSPALVEKGLEKLGAMSWRDFSVVLDTAFTRQGYTVSQLSGGADLLLEKKHVRTVVSAKRWKAAAMGVEPLRELVSRRDALEASNSVCISLGQVSAKAQEFAADNRISLITGADLVILVDEEIKAL